MNITCTEDLTMEEMTEASERIYNEVGENAEIIWGAVIDNSLGDEMRVTVIATGIGSGPENSIPKKFQGNQIRGKVRDITPADIQNAVNYDEPTFIRQQEAVGESNGAFYRGYKGMVVDKADLEIPTFLRRKAD